MFPEGIAYPPVMSEARARQIFPLLADVSTTPGASKIPRAGGAGTIAAGWIPDLSAVYSVVAHVHDDRYYTEAEIAAVLSGYQPAGNYQLLDGDLTAIAALSGTGYAQKTGVNTWALATLGTLATQDANAVAITGGNIDATFIGTVTPSEGYFSVLVTTDTFLVNKASSGNLMTTTSTSSSTNAITNLWTMIKNSTGTPTTNFGEALLFQLHSSTTVAQNAARFQVLWATATHASRKARGLWTVYDTAEREAVRIEASGTAAMIGFLGAAAVVRQVDGAALTNNVTAGGTTDTIANFTDLITYANDAAAIRNDIYQLARKTKIIGDALRLYGLLT